ncbi:hypothetical protein BT67DRAFT_372201 [Trichocladium antarcticum]|uniref:Uncharacterized protein n=1 Tax=Trichocladium antarcticum TaxID=1450529 RepID=A0AAN6ZHR1_9PEZI|nr:hypothetical protein BT67DRAFT_372201 [Trichocladium antarcticum]
MTRTVVYSAALVALVAATAMTLASIIHPNWVSYTVTSPAGDTVYDTIGLHRRCSSTTNKCVPFPDPARCPGRAGSDGGRASFCAMWRTTGFLMSFAVVAQLAAAVGFLITMAGGRVKRHGGWRLLAGALLVVAAAQFLGMAVVVGCLRFIHTYLPPFVDAGDAYLFDHDDFFLVPGYRLDSSWYLCTSSAAVALLAACGLAIAAAVLPPEDGYLFLGDSGGV